MENTNNNEEEKKAESVEIEKEELTEVKKIEEEESKELNEVEMDADENDSIEEIKDRVSMDKIIYEAFMNALKISIKETNLPMEPSTLTNSHMKLCTTQNIDFRLSSYKRVYFYII